MEFPERLADAPGGEHATRCRATNCRSRTRPGTTIIPAMNTRCAILLLLPALTLPAFGADVDCDAADRAPDVRCSAVVTVLAQPPAGNPRPSDERSAGEATGDPAGQTLWRLWV